MEENRAKITTVKTSLELINKQVQKKQVDLARQRDRLCALEKAIEEVQSFIATAQPTPVTTQMSLDLEPLRDFLEDVFAQCAWIEEERKIAAEEKKIAAEERAQEAKRAADREIEEKKLAAEIQAQEAKRAADREMEDRKIAADREMEEKKLAAEIQTADKNRAAEREIERMKIESSERTAHQTLAAEIERARLTADFELKRAGLLKSNDGAQTITHVNKQSSAAGFLPKLNIPTFCGDPITWLNFQDLFKALVGDNTALNSSQKLQYLKNALRGQAAQLVSNLPSTDANFEVAWKMLTERYSSPRDLVHAYIKRLMEIPVQNKETAEGLRKMTDTTTEIIRSLEILGRMPKLGQDIIIYLLSQRISAETRKDWMISFKDKDPPELDQLLKFLELRAEALHSVQGKSAEFKSTDPNTNDRNKRNNNNNSNKRKIVAATTDRKSKCAHCLLMGHLIYQCRAFADLSPSQRKEWIIQQKRCFRCLTPSHSVKECRSKHTCAVCHGLHNTLIHLDAPSRQHDNQRSPAATTLFTAQVEDTPVQHVLNPMSVPFAPQLSACTTGFVAQAKNSTETLLFTAQVLVRARNGRYYNCRALIDCGSQSSLISEDAARHLWLPRRRSSIDILGISGRNPTKNLGEVDLCIKSKVNEQFELNTTAIVLPRLTSNLPLQRLVGSKWTHLIGLQLADAKFYEPARIDMILGQDVFSRIMLPETVHGGCNQPSAFKSQFGWLLGGASPTAGGEASTKQTLVHHSLNFLLQRFWETEQVSQCAPPLNKVDKWTEDHFADTTERLSDGSYQVRLPIIQDTSILGSSLPMATKRLQSVERRLEKDPELHSQYKEFMDEYEKLGHMREVPVEELPQQRNFIPHHPVLKADSLTTRLRVVFDGSASTDTGVSLNDILARGPTVQAELFDVLLQYRTHRIALNVDVVKMYRSFQIHEDDRPLQSILWRPDPLQPVKIYELGTVTYGLKPSSYLATRCLIQLARDERERFPHAAQVLLNQTYVDDLMTGGESVGEVIKLRDELIGIASAGRLKLNKWSSNNSQVLAALQEDDVIVQSPHNLDRDDIIKILGVVWLPLADVFSVRVTTPVIQEPLTKRQMVGHLARLFDPLGFLTPIIVWAKILIQKLWSAKTDWDEPVSDIIASQWKAFQLQVNLVSSVRVPRFIGNDLSGFFELAGFCDASSSGYCACIYARLTNLDATTCNLLVAKSKVAPLKSLSIPRLELCSALLLAQLVSRVASTLRVPAFKIKLFSDSQVVLAWLNSPPANWNVFVSNRVAEIQNLTEGCTWYYVNTLLNPADIGTRGLLPADIVNNDLWFLGPSFLTDVSHDYSSMIFNNSDIQLPERRKVVAVIETHVTEPIDKSFDLTSLCSDWQKLQRVTAYIFRFINNCRTKFGPKVGGSLTLSELDNAASFHLRKVQREHFAGEINACKQQVNISNKSSLVSLNPYLDEHNLLRVHSRLTHAPISPRRKHPIILPRKSVLTSLIVLSIHARRLHAGATVTHTFLRLTFWVIGGLSAVKAILRRCVTCARFRTNVTDQLMGALPPCRVWPNPPFSRVGTDFCGPFMVRAFKGRKFALGKAYICLFVCMSTKAIHLELVSGLSSSDFINAFRRFVARRGLCSVVYSDHGTNFVGAQRELRSILREAIVLQEDSIRQQLANDGIEWRFTPVESPHFGGIWEGNIKILKRHLAKVSSSQYWTVEQLSTILCEAEACLNSRPLCPLSDSPDELEALTPAHFLIGRSLTTVPALQETEEPLVQNYRLLSSKVQGFWDRWSKEYLATLMSRPKWRLRRAQVKIGDLVVVKERALPPSKWRLGRVIGVIPGSDNLTRLVTLRTQAGLIQRAIRNIVVLFNENDNIQDV